jgi:hypothetical protein
MTSIKDLKKSILLLKRTDLQRSLAFASVLRQVELKTIGVLNPETDEQKLILAGAKKELKEQEQSKASGAPFSETTILVCSELISLLSPKLMSENETSVAIDAIISNGESNKGKIMGILKKEYSDLIDMALANKLLDKKLSC